jgi:hypothetical protein
VFHDKSTKEWLETIKGSSRKLLRSRGVLLVEVSNLALSVSEICCRLPKVGAFFVAFLFNFVLKLMTENIGVHDFVDFVLFFTFQYDWVRQWRFVKNVVLIESESIDVEDGVEL